MGILWQCYIEHPNQINMKSIWNKCEINVKSIWNFIMLYIDTNITRSQFEKDFQDCLFFLIEKWFSKIKLRWGLKNNTFECIIFFTQLVIENLLLMLTFSIPNSQPSFFSVNEIFTVSRCNLPYSRNLLYFVIVSFIAKIIVCLFIYRIIREIW